MQQPRRIRSSHIDVRNRSSLRRFRHQRIFHDGSSRRRFRPRAERLIISTTLRASRRAARGRRKKDGMRDGHFCGESGTADRWKWPVASRGTGARRGSLQQEGRGRARPTASVLSSGALDGVVSRLMSSEGEYRPRRGRRTMPDSSPRSVDAAFTTRYSQDADKSTYSRKSEEEARARTARQQHSPSLSFPAPVRIDRNWRSRGKESGRVFLMRIADLGVPSTDP